MDNYDPVTYEQYVKMYKNEQDSMLFDYFKNAMVEKRRALAYLLYQRGYRDFGYTK